MNKNNLYQTDKYFAIALSCLEDAIKDIATVSVYREDIFNEQVSKLLTALKEIKEADKKQWREVE